MLSINAICRRCHLARFMVICISCMLLSTIIPSVETNIMGTELKYNSILQGNKIYVGGNGTNNYSKIQDAIDSANDGDVIIVYPGFYEEHLIIKKAIRICGSGWKNTIIDGSSKGNVISIYHDNVIINNFTIKNCGEISSVIRVDNCKNVTISNNFITSIERHTGIDVHPSGMIQMHNIHIYGNIINNFISGIEFSCSNSQIENNLIENTTYAIGLGGNNLTISKNIIRNCSDGISVCFDNERNLIIQNKILDCSTGISLEGEGNIIKRNEFMRNKYGIYVYMGKNNLIHSNNFIKNGIGAYLEGWLADLPLINEWKENYWYNHNGSLPKIILGRIIWGGYPRGHYKHAPWINVDWHPATEPYGR